MASNRILGVRVMSRLRRLPLAWPRAASRAVRRPAVRDTTVAVTRWLARLGVARHRSVPMSDVLLPAAGSIEGPLPLVVRPVWRSRAVELVSGPVPSGSAPVDCIVQRVPVLTDRQRLLLDMSWTESRPILYQPVDSPDVTDWLLVRSCTDRFEMMRTFLAERSIEGNGRQYVDLACNYGWFVQAMLGLGFDAGGVELDRRAGTIAQVMYGLDPARIRVGDVVDHLSDPHNTVDVASCFSLAHHFVVMGQPDVATKVMQLLGERSTLGFFFDMGQAHEGWLAGAMPGWDAEHVGNALADANPSMTVISLGIDSDAVGVHATEYGRTLFAVWR